MVPARPDSAPPGDPAGSARSGPVPSADRPADRGSVDWATLAADQPRLARFATRVLGDAAEGEDLAQEALLRLWQRRDRADALPRDPSARRAWLYKTVHRLCLDRLRRGRVRRWLGLDWAEEIVDPSPRADAVLERDAVSEQVRAALDRLPERQRVALILFHFEGLSQSEAAAALEIGDAALESLLARGRRTLRRLLSEVDLRDG